MSAEQNLPEPDPEAAQAPEDSATAEQADSPDAAEDLPSPPAAPMPAASQSGQDKRQSTRHNVRWRCLLLLGKTKMPAMVTDFSDGGMSFVAANTLPANTRVEAALFIPDIKNPGTYLVSSVTIEIIYSVLCRQEFKFGVKFIKPPSIFLDRARAAIRNS